MIFLLELNRRCLYYNWKFWPFNVSLAGRQLSHRVAAEYGTGGRLGWQSAKDTLMTYLEDGHCSLSNNLSENAIRPFTVGRKNWLFSASPKGAASSAIVYTMVEMAKANDLNTYKYLAYLLSQRPDAKMSDEQLEQLAPWSETAKANCQN